MGWAISNTRPLEGEDFASIPPKMRGGEDYPLAPPVPTALDYRLEALLAFEWLPKL